MPQKGLTMPWKDLALLQKDFPAPKVAHLCAILGIQGCAGTGVGPSFEGVSLTTVILASGAENLGSEVPAVHHFRQIRWNRQIRHQFPSSSQTV